MKSTLPWVGLMCLLLVFSSCSSQGQTAENTIPELTKEDTISTLNLLFVGDVMGHSPQIKSAYNAATKSYDYEPVFKYVKPIIESADFAVANLEVTLGSRPPFSGYPRFRSPDALGYALKQAGFDMIVTANNHSNDAGKNGLIHTIDTLQGLGFYQTGTFKNLKEKEAKYPLIVFKDDFKLAFLNYTYGTNGLPDVPPTMVNMIDTLLIEKDIKTAKKLEPDAIIVLMHWGLEYKLIESDEQRDLAQKLFNWGADLIIGAHPHVVQPIKKSRYISYDGKTRNILVTYSLGNFISNQRQPNTDGGLMFEIDLEKHKTTKEVSMVNPRYIPVWRYIHSDSLSKRTYHAIPVSAFENDSTNLLQMSETDASKMKAFAKKTRDSLNQYGAIERILKATDIFPALETEQATQPSSDNETGQINESFETGSNQIGLVYKIQWQALANFNQVTAPVDGEIEIRKEHNVFKFLIGAERTLEAAKILLQKVHAAGFPEAFIVSFKNGIKE